MLYGGKRGDRWTVTFSDVPPNRPTPQPVWALAAAASGGSEYLDVQRAWHLWRTSRPDLDDVTTAEVELLPLAWTAAQRVGVEDPDAGRLNGLCRRSAVTGALATAHTSSLMAGLADNGVPAVLSAAAAARLHYSNPKLRILRRVDVLADRSRVAAIGQLDHLTVRERLLGRRVVSKGSGFTDVLWWRLPARVSIAEMTRRAVTRPHSVAASPKEESPYGHRIRLLDPTDTAVVVLVETALRAAPGTHSSMLWAVDVHQLSRHNEFDRDRFTAMVTRAGFSSLLAAHGRAWQGRLPAAITSLLAHGASGRWRQAWGETQGRIVGGIRKGAAPPQT